MAEKSKPDAFDFIGDKFADALIETARACDGFNEPFRSGAITALEEFFFRLTGKHWDWEEYKIVEAAYELTKTETSADG